MIKAIWEDCPGVVNDGVYGHSMRDFCSSCAPFWSRIPLCPTHRRKLNTSGFCKSCKKYYDLKKTKTELKKWKE